eukprot:5968229-Prymnesium_polylepis.1
MTSDAAHSCRPVRSSSAVAPSTCVGSSAPISASSRTCTLGSSLLSATTCVTSASRPSSSPCASGSSCCADECCSRSSTISALPIANASVEIERPKLFCASTSTLAKSRRKAFTASTCPCCTAQCSGTLPDALGSSRAPAAASTSMQPTWPLAPALCSAVLPESSQKSTGTPARSSACMDSMSSFSP